MSPRRKTTNLDMPTHVHWKNGAWRFKTPKHLIPFVPGRKTWLKLGTEKREALQEYAKLMGNLSNESGMSKLFNRYEADVIPTKAPRTQKDNRKELKQLRSVFGNMHPAELTTMHCQQYLDIRGKQSKTQANHEIALLSHIFRKAMQWGVVNSNPVKGVEKHRVKARDRNPEHWEIDEFLSVATPFITAWVDFKLMTGLRQGDILALKVDVLRTDGIWGRASKTGKRYFVEMDNELKAAIKALMACNRVQGLTVVCNRSGQPLTEDAFRNRWQDVMNKALAETKLSERFTEHDLRARYATDLDEMGGDVQESLQHSDRRTSDTYIRSKRPSKITVLSRKKSGE
ncbi:tyrosine-type recombinase/integrase [Marinobacter salarius]|uniref:tyrosine-type recombinase/integrase n=1 Tax=Marinobacter salarius TaxID=1420917 RepID=UPI003D10AA34